ncbi:hypothetical protein FAGAP_8220 [Fusarium agapanthi]|uniref:Hsp70 protein n=1 Tax=Fusarium agapanthi TaxID=1803897 RepID=A0A9P5E568_9HYPO|nr:hypothetical protein FAGAP_8220 [Fusarium agapanthi]
MPSLQTPSKLVVAIDFGETKFSVSYALLPEVVHPECPYLAVRTVQNCPDGISMQRGNSMYLQVPTLMRYPNDWAFRPLDELRSKPPGTGHPGNDQVQWGFQNLINQSENHEIQNRHLIETLHQLSKNVSCSRETSVHEMVLLVTVDYLTNLLSHAKTEITGSTMITSTELFICVPVIWRQNALRDIQTCVTIAAKRANFPGVDIGNDCVTKVFMITEPETAATWLLSNRSIIRKGDVFTIFDAGGGTCDALTYIVTRKSPLRLERQPVHHSGGTCGSNALNDAFRKLLENLLADHGYLSEDGATLEGHICKLATHDFEHLVKPRWVVSENSQDCKLEVFGLRSDPGSRNQASGNQRTCPNQLTIQAEHLNSIYRHICGDVSMLMTKQLHATSQLGLKTAKFVLMGGFGDSKPLRNRLREALASFNAAHGSNVELYVADEHERITAVDAVSSGGVSRALNKLYGPARFAKSSYGIRCDEPFERPKHTGQTKVQGCDDGQEFFVEAIQWITKKASLYYAQRIGILKTDVTHLHQQFLHVKEGAQGPGDNDSLSWYWKFPYELVLTIDGLNMKYVQVFNGQVIGEMKVGIAPGFAPGAN